jgi:hypothetical protein
VVDVQTISIVIASASVVAGVIYYALQLRHQIKQRQTDLLVRLFSSVNNKDWLEAWEKVRDREILDHGDYKAKYGFVELNEVFVFFEQLGRLLQKKLIDIDLLPFGPGQVKATWEKIKPVLEGGRKSYNEPKLGYGFEYLYNEMKKREQRLQRGVKNG